MLAVDTPVWLAPTCAGLTVRRYLASGWLEPPRTLWFGCPVHNVAAKESSQETAVTLLGLVSGMVVAAYTDLTPTQSWCFFGALTMLHVVSNLR